MFALNNFDIIRLFAALQVAVDHTFDIMAIHVDGWLQEVLRFSSIIPGVPIFFFISGFLISKSFESNSCIKEYSQNRILRLYPGLFTCVTLSFVFIFASGYWVQVNASFLEWFGLYAAKTSFLQFYNPDFMRAYGDGVLNGSLWTLTVELQFYVLIPIIYTIFKLKDSEKPNRILLILLVIFLITNRLYDAIPPNYYKTIPVKLLRVSFIPWFYMFLTGVLVQRNFSTFHKYLAGKFWLMLPIYLGVGSYALHNEIKLGNNLNPIMFFILIPSIFSLAYSFVTFSTKLLRRNDISYGVYIYHMPIVNVLIYLGLSGQIKYSLLALFLCFVVAFLSWRFIESPSLKLKKHPLNPLKAKNLIFLES